MPVAAGTAPDPIRVTSVGRNQLLLYVGFPPSGAGSGGGT